MKRIALKLSVLLLLGGIVSIAASGCRILFQTHTVTNDQNHWGGFRPGQVYELQQDAFLLRFKAEPDKWGTELVRPGDPDFDTPSMQAYSIEPTKHSSSIRGVLHQGTKMTVTRLM